MFYRINLIYPARSPPFLEYKSLLSICRQFKQNLNLEIIMNIMTS